MPAVAVDGLLVATQYDLPWDDPLGGFELYEQVHALKFIRAGLEVGIARQPEATWCVHWGPLRERTPAQLERRSQELARRARLFRELYRDFLGVPALELLRRYDRRPPERAGVQAAGAAGSSVAAGTAPGISGKVAAGRGAAVTARRERLGAAIVTFNGLNVLRRALRALDRECAELAGEGVDTEIVVVDNASTDGTVEAVRQEFPRVTVVANPSNDGPARGFNLALRALGVGRCGRHEEAGVGAAAGAAGDAGAGEGSCLPDYFLITSRRPRRPDRDSLDLFEAIMQTAEQVHLIDCY